MPLPLLAALLFMFIIWLYFQYQEEEAKLRELAQQALPSSNPPTPRQRLPPPRSNPPPNPPSNQNRPPHVPTFPLPERPHRASALKSPNQPVQNQDIVVPSKSQTTDLSIKNIHVLTNTSSDEYLPPAPTPLLPPRRKPIISNQPRQSRQSDSNRTTTYNMPNSRAPGRPMPMPSKQMRQIGFRTSDQNEPPPPRIQRHPTGYVYNIPSDSDSDELVPYSSSLTVNNSKQIDGLSNDIISRPSNVASDVALAERQVSSDSIEMPPQKKAKRNEKPLTKYAK